MLREILEKEDFQLDASGLCFWNVTSGHLHFNMVQLCL